MRLYKSCVCSIMTYGSEAWKLTGNVIAALNGANARMVNIITGRTSPQEAHFQPGHMDTSSAPSMARAHSVNGIRASCQTRCV